MADPKEKKPGAKKPGEKSKHKRKESGRNMPAMPKKDRTYIRSRLNPAFVAMQRPIVVEMDRIISETGGEVKIYFKGDPNPVTVAEFNSDYTDY